MCLAIPGKILKIDGQKATIQYPEEQRFAMVGGEEVLVGDYVMVQMGIIIKKLSEEEAKVSAQAWAKSNINSNHQ
jgi:hydrogenase expression/formation protein HypC